ncbi:Hypothetical predicted protein [Mytilus galloprovincialis]|uniref:Novel STAND NTPase 3 domain-containing protein n=1 Tax=Mytilus galloprovincialis TaxID=29158 RepID=A0A8B6HTQ1_MYTGA|nr:Hypothetical predicted protein [Mytilus galloprovincialis]
MGGKTVETSAIKELNFFIKMSNCIAVIGPFDCGKSTAVHHVALLLYRNDGYQIIPSQFSKDITDYFNESEKQIFVFDDVCGKPLLDDDLMKQWLRLRTELNKIKQRKNVKILVSSRSDVFCQLKDVQVLFTTQFDMLSNDNSLNDNERFLIAKAHIGAEKAEILRTAEFCNRYDFYPLLCQKFDTQKERDIKKFFSQPVDLIKAELTSMKEEKDQTSFAVLALFVIYNNYLSDKVLSPTSGIETTLSDIAGECELPTLLNIKVVRKQIERFLNSYVKKIGSVYMIMYDKLFDIFVSFYGEHLFDIIFTHCCYEVIFTRFQLQSVEDVDKCMIKIPVEKEAKYFKRFFHVCDVYALLQIFWHPQLKLKTFRQQFLQFLSEDQVCRDLCLSLSNTGSSPLFKCAANGFTDIVQVLLDIGMNANIYNASHLTPIYFAAAAGYFETFKLLLENNADINNQPRYPSLLYLTLANGYTDIYFTLTLNSYYCGWQMDEYVEMNQDRRDTEIVKLLLQNDVDLSEDLYARTPLYLATLFSNTDILKLLLKQNSRIDQYDIFHLTPLYVASLCNHVEIVEILLEQGCDTNICSRKNESPLYVASKWGHVDIVKLLLDKHCNIHICNTSNESPLHAASTCWCCTVDSECIENYNSDGDRWYEMCLRKLNEFSPVSKDDYVEIVKALLMHNADVNIINKSGKNPMEVALENGNSEIVKLLSEQSSEQQQ